MHTHTYTHTHKQLADKVYTTQTRTHETKSIQQRHTLHRNNVTCSHIKTYIKRIHTTTIINTGVQTKLSELMKCSTLTINNQASLTRAMHVRTLAQFRTNTFSFTLL